MLVEIGKNLCYNTEEMTKKGEMSLKRRIFGLFLTVLIFGGILAATRTNVSAAAEMKASDDAVTVLKAEEGFSQKPYWDYAQWTVGYGTKCPDDKLEYYKENGITHEEAEQLLRSYIARFEGEINRFSNRTGTLLNQNQFDALMLFSYNCGTAWAYSTNGIFYNAIVSGATGSELVNAFSRWCNAGGQIKTYLLRRRLSEANMYLNGVYSQTPPDNYGYVLYDPCGGTVSPNVQGYDTELNTAIIPTAKHEQYTFAGWYTQKTGGTKVERLDASVKNSRLYARWEEELTSEPEIQPAEGITVTVTGTSVNVRKGPGTNHAVVSTVKAGQKLVVTQTETAGGYTWGKTDKGWVCLKYTDYKETPEPKPEEPAQSKVQKGTVKVSDVLRVRSGPSTGYPVVARLSNGAKVEILEQKTVGTMAWGRIAKGWISMDYVVLEKEQEEQTPPATQLPETQPPETEPPATKPETQEQPQKWTGTVKVSDVLRVRSGPGTSNKIVGYLYPGDKVIITEQAESGSMTWGKTEKGWVSMTYIVLDKTEQKPAEQKLTGTVKVNDILRVRSGPGTSYAIAGYLSNGAKVEITEQKTVNGMRWGKISKGWISLDYVQPDGENTKPQTQTKTVTADCLRIRSDAGTTNKIVGCLYKGDKVEILETKKVGNTTWGRIAKGWVSLDYVK